MLNSDLVENLRTFSIVEQERLDLFLQSPYWVNGKDISKESALIRHVLRVLSNGDILLNKELLHREHVYGLLFPGREFNGNTFRNLLTSSLNLVHEFIHIERTRNSFRPVGLYSQSVQFFTEKGETDLAGKYLQRLERLQATNISKDLHDFYHDFEADHAKTAFEASKTEVKDDLKVLQAIKSLEIFFWAQKLNLLLSLFNQQSFTAVLRDTEANEIIHNTETALKAPWLDTPLFRLHLLALRFIQPNSVQAEAYFDEFMEGLNVHEKDFSLYHLKRLELIATNFCIRNFQNPKYRKILFTLHKQRLLRNLQEPEKRVHALEFLSDLKTSILGEQFDFVQSYIEQNRHKITGPQSSEQYYLFAVAYLCFSKNQINRAREIMLSLPNFYDNGYKYFSKLLEIKIFYEGGPSDQDLFKTRLNNLRMILVRENSLSREKKNGYENFLKIAFKLDRLRQKQNPSKGRLTDLLEEIETEPDLNERFWLKKKILDLLG